MSRGLIIIGYQGIGKSTHAGEDGCIDLESSQLFVNGERQENWYVIYCKIAINLAKQGYTVFVSSHKVVREYLKVAHDSIDGIGYDVCVFCPPLKFKTVWINRLKNRYQNTKSAKDYKAYMNAVEDFDNNITELCNSGFPVYHPATMRYDLMGYVQVIRRGFENYGEQ